MNMKDLKMYEAPACEVEEMELQGFLCASTNVPGVDVEEPGEEY
jgi:hypothetical protein